MAEKQIDQNESVGETFLIKGIIIIMVSHPNAGGKKEEIPTYNL